MQEIQKYIRNYQYSAEQSFHIPNTVRLLGDYTFERKGSSIYWPFNGHCIVVNNDFTKCEKLPLKIDKTRFILVSTPNLKLKSVHEFNSDRLQECDKALNLIQKKKKINALTELSLKDYREIEHFIPNPILRKRTYHIVSEQYRVEEAVKAIKNDNHIMFGKIMKASNSSFIENYDFFDEEVKALFNLIKELNIFGFRLLTGHQFGNILCLVENDKLSEFKTTLQSKNPEIEFSEIKDD